jgi:hypothetical protein
VKRSLILCALANLLLPTAAHAQPTIEVRGDTACPSAEMIQAAVKADRPDGEGPPMTVVVEVTDERLTLTLVDDREKDQNTQREIPAANDCETRAQTVALVLRAWTGALPSHPTDAPMLTVAMPAPVIAPAKRPPHTLAVDGAAFYSPIWGHAPGAWLGVGRTPKGGGLGIRLFGAFQSSQDVSLEGGTNQLSREWLGGAATLELERGRLFGSGDVGLLTTFTQARGSGYDSNQAAHTFNVGGIVDLRGGIVIGRYHLWLNARALRLLHQETVNIASSSPGVADRVTLRAWDAQFGLGFGMRFQSW